MSRHSRLTHGVQLKKDESFEQGVRRALRDAFAAGCEAADTRSPFTAGQWADREAPKVADTLRTLSDHS
jgi:hypothetical protein